MSVLLSQIDFSTMAIQAIQFVIQVATWHVMNSIRLDKNLT